MYIRILIIALLLLFWASADATSPEYSSSRKWVEQRCATNATPQAERVFVGRIWEPQYAGIFHFQKGMTLRDVIDQAPFKGKTVQVLVLRPGAPFKHHYITVGPSDKPKSEVKPLDMIWLYDPGPIVET
jgi:hypothetical protein